MRTIEGISFPLDGIAEQPELTIGARELHSYLENGQQFWQWLKSAIDEWGFVPHQDFKIVVQKTSSVGVFEYQLSLNMARQLVIVEPNAKGKRARRYYIECESRANPTMGFDDFLRAVRTVSNEKQGI